MHDGDRRVVPVGRERGQHGDHRGHTDTRGGEQQGPPGHTVEHQIAVRLRQFKDVTHPYARVQLTGHLPVRRRTPVHPLDAELPYVLARRPGQAVLPYLPRPVGQFHPHGDVLPRPEAPHGDPSTGRTRKETTSAVSSSRPTTSHFRNSWLPLSSYSRFSMAMRALAISQ